MKTNDIDRFYRTFCHFIKVVQQYSEKSVLAQAEAVIPERFYIARSMKSYSDKLLAMGIAQWFKTEFMKWSKDPNLVRYEDIPTLLQTRVGRCGEWAILYTGMLLSKGLKARLVLDWSDHVWTEVFSEGEWHHIDSTLDNMVDQPYFYERNWGKKLSYIIAFSPDKIEDVTINYTTQKTKVAKRRKIDPVPRYLIELYNLGASQA